MPAHALMFRMPPASNPNKELPCFAHNTSLPTAEPPACKKAPDMPPDSQQSLSRVMVVVRVDIAQSLRVSKTTKESSVGRR